jgi:hypothetical protein
VISVLLRNSVASSRTGVPLLHQRPQSHSGRVALLILEAGHRQESRHGIVAVTQHHPHQHPPVPLHRLVPQFCE